MSPYPHDTFFFEFLLGMVQCQLNLSLHTWWGYSQSMTGRRNWRWWWPEDLHTHAQMNTFLKDLYSIKYSKITRIFQALGSKCLYHVKCAHVSEFTDSSPDSSAFNIQNPLAPDHCIFWHLMPFEYFCSESSSNILNHAIPFWNLCFHKHCSAP